MVAVNLVAKQHYVTLLRRLDLPINGMSMVFLIARYQLEKTNDLKKSLSPRNYVNLTELGVILQNVFLAYDGLAR